MPTNPNPQQAKQALFEWVRSCCSETMEHAEYEYVLGQKVCPNCYCLEMDYKEFDCKGSELQLHHLLRAIEDLLHCKVITSDVLSAKDGDYEIVVSKKYEIHPLFAKVLYLFDLNHSAESQPDQFYLDMYPFVPDEFKISPLNNA